MNFVFSNFIFLVFLLFSRFTTQKKNHIFKPPYNILCVFLVASCRWTAWELVLSSGLHYICYFRHY